jgi:hypothetical protein
MPPPFTSYTPVADWVKAADHPISNPKLQRADDSSQLLKNRVSNNVGSVKHIQGAPIPGLVRARHFALVEAFALAFAFALPTKARS